MGGDDPKYTGPHQSMRCTADSKISEWYSHDETENKDIKADGQTTWDAKYKHKTGYCRYKLKASCPKVGESYNFLLKDDSYARFEWQGLTTHIQWERDTFAKEVDFGTYHSNSFFMNPYYRWESDKNFTTNSLVLGCILRYGDWMFRQHVSGRELNVAEGKLKDICVLHKGKFVKDEFSFEWYKRANITTGTFERWKALLSWANKDYGVRLQCKGRNLNMPEPSFFLRYRACDKMSLGCHYTYDLDKQDAARSPHHWHAGGKYVGDKDTTLRFTTNNDLNTKMNISHRLSDSSTMNFTVGHNLKSWMDGSKSYSKGFLGYPWNYGLVFKLDG